jgi:hypothetical protein
VTKAFVCKLAISDRAYFLANLLLEIQENFFGPSVGLKLVVSTLQCPLK